MATTNRWFFRCPPSPTIITLDGDPRDHPGWVKWDRTYRPDGRVLCEYAIVVFHGKEYRGTYLRATQSDAIACNRNCETAKEPKCTCQCGGKNHGIAHKIEADEISLK
jgi:hypothetical protein